MRTSPPPAGSPSSRSSDFPADPPEATITRISHARVEIDAVRERLVGALRAAGYREASCFAVRLAYEEAVANAVRHGNRQRADGRIEIAYHVSPREVFLRVTDEGEGFDPDAVMDPTLDENLECASGRGLLLMRAYMATVRFNARGNSVAMIHQRRTS